MSLPFGLVFILALVFTCGARSATPALPCGDQPELPADAAAQISSDAKAKADLIRRAPPRGERVWVTARRRELREKFADVDKSTLDRYLLWVTCQSISKDPVLAGSQKFDEYSNVYRLLSEPIDKAASHEE